MKYLIENVAYDHTSGILGQHEGSIRLTRTQRKLLNFFIEHPKQVASKQTLMEEVWGRIVTENSVDQVISILRGYLEPDPAQPIFIVTHYGLGFSFEADFSRVEDDPSESADPKAAGPANHWPGKIAVLVALFLVVMFLFQFMLRSPDQAAFDGAQEAGKQMLILPMTFGDATIGEIEQSGMRALLRNTFDRLQSEGEMIFDETSLTTAQAIEKHWRLENDLVVMRSNVVKNGEIYEAVVELSRGLKTIKTTTLSATSLNDLVSSQILFMSDFQQLEDASALSALLPKSSDQLYIEALAYRKRGDLAQARALIERLLSVQQDHHQARLSLAEILLAEKSYAESRAQLNTLKVTPAYQLYGTEIELGLARIKFQQKEFEILIHDLKQYQANHLDVGRIKKAKIRILIANAYLALADRQNAMLFYQQALIDLDEQLNPSIYSQSFYGQGKVRMFEVIDKSVDELFEKSLAYAKTAGDLHQQTLALNAMSHIALSSYEWDRAIRLNKQALQIMELDNDKEGTASGLGTLVAMLNLRGQFTEAKQVNDRFFNIARELNSDALMLHYLHYDVILAMNEFDWNRAATQIEKQYRLAEASKDYPMLLNNAFLALELLLLKKDSGPFLAEWKKRAARIKELGFERYQVYMDLYLGRYYGLIEDNERAIELMEAVSAEAKSRNDIKILVDAQDRLAQVYLQLDSQKALDILNALEQYDPHPNPYLDLKAKALHNLGRNIDALSVLNQAKSIYHESWTAENQALLETIKQAIN